MLKRNKRFLLMLLTLALPFGCVGCSDGGSASYDQISGAEAKALMDSESGYIIIDARTQEEYDQGHIPEAILIPEYEIADRAEKELPDKDQLILVYCRSGRRSKIAAEELVKLGYTNIKEFGGIIDWEYETVKD
jgi:rhodanese-related sulfurtransferase